MKKKETTPKVNSSVPVEPKTMLFSKENYILTGASLLVVVIGFVLMIGKTGDIYDFRRTTLAPIVVVSGFILGIYAIFYRKK